MLFYTPQVYWYRNDVELDLSYESGDNRAENELIFTVQPSDNEAVYRCEASNLVTPVPLKKEIKLKVLCKCADFVYQFLKKTFLVILYDNTMHCMLIDN